MTFQPDFQTDLSGTVALVTGCTSGLGKRFAKVLASQGAKVAITGRRVERLADLKAEIEADGGTVLALPLDVTDEESIKTCVAKVEDGLGPINILVNNAGMSINALAVDVAAPDFDIVMDTNVRGVFLMAREVAKGMIARGQGGQIVNIASIAAFEAMKASAAYCASKAAVAQLTRQLALEWARYNINVNAICPGFIVTEINEDFLSSPAGEKMLKAYPKRRVGQESDLDGALLLLASPKSRFITGTLLTVDDGQTL